MSDTSNLPEIGNQELKDGEALVGFGGWFVLVLLSLFATTVINIFDFIQYFEIWQYVDFGLGCLYIVDYLNTIILSIVILIFYFS